jgi:hypothetical protein
MYVHLNFGSANNKFQIRVKFEIQQGARCILKYICDKRTYFSDIRTLSDRDIARDARTVEYTMYVVGLNGIHSC